MIDRAFTILEVLVVIVITALLGTLTGLSLRGVAADVTIEEVAARIAAYDKGARVYAARFGRPVTLVVNEHAIEQLEPDADDDFSPREPLRIPAKFTATFVTALDDEAVAISSDGRSRSYAVELLGPTGLQRCIVIAGMTGRSATAATADEARELLAVERDDEPGRLGEVRDAP